MPAPEPATRRDASGSDDPRLDFNPAFGDPASQLWERHKASDFDTKTQDKLAPAEG